MDVQVNPRVASLTATIAAGVTASPALVVGPWIQGAPRRGVVQLPSQWVTCTTTFKVAVASGGAYVDLYAKDGTQAKIASMVASRAYELPDACLVGVYGLKLIKSAKQTTTAGAATITTRFTED